MKKNILILLFAFSANIQASSHNPISPETLALASSCSMLAAHGAGALLHYKHDQLKNRAYAAYTDGQITPDNLAGIQEQYIAGTDLGLQSGTPVDFINDVGPQELALVVGSMPIVHSQAPDLSNIYIGAHLTMMMPKLLNVLNAQHRLNSACNQAESITLDHVQQFHSNDLNTLKNKQTLAQANVLIQRENELIDKVNEELFFGEKVPKSNLSSKLYRLQEHRKIGKSREMVAQENELRYKIENQKTAVKNKIEEYQLKDELLQPKQEAAVLIGTKLPTDLTRDIVTEWLPSSSSERTRLIDCAINQLLTSDWKKPLEILKKEQQQSDEEWKQLNYRNKHNQWLSSMKSCDKKVALLKFVR